MPRKLDLERHFLEARKYKSRSEFARQSQGSYYLLWKHGLLNEACPHMEISARYVPPKWDREAVTAVAARYASRAEFKRCAGGAYTYAKDKKLLDEVCAHMKVLRKRWDADAVLAEARKFSTPSEFKQACSSGYKHACRLKILDQAFAHMNRKAEWTKDRVIEVAKGFSSVPAFRESFDGAYKYALYNGFLDEACEHMDESQYGFDDRREASLYFMEISLNDGGSLYKVGITNRNPTRRISGMGVGLVKSIVVIGVCRYRLGRDARMAERALHRRFAAFRYSGPPVLSNGNTELFTKNIAILAGE